MKDYTFGNNLFRLRTNRGYTQRQLGYFIGVTDKAVSKWENGSAYPTSKLLMKLATFFAISVDSLMKPETVEEIEKKNGSNDNEMESGESTELDEQFYAETYGAVEYFIRSMKENCRNIWNMMKENGLEETTVVVRCEQIVASELRSGNVAFFDEDIGKIIMLWKKDDEMFRAYICINRKEFYDDILQKARTEIEVPVIMKAPEGYKPKENRSDAVDVLPELSLEKRYLILSKKEGHSRLNDIKVNVTWIFPHGTAGDISCYLRNLTSWKGKYNEDGKLISSTEEKYDLNTLEEINRFLEE